MADTSNQIVGLVRFSYIAKGGGFAHSEAPQAEQEAAVFAPDRIERRFKLFEALALRSLLGQSDQDFRCVFLISESFPQVYKDRLQDLVAPLAGSLVQERPMMPHFQAIRMGYETVADGQSKYLTTFRLDDDDMLDRGFIARVRDRAVRAVKLSGRNGPLVLSFNRGFYLNIGRNENSIFDAGERTPLSVGSAMITKQGSRQNIYSRNHRKLPSFFATYSDVDTPGWLRTLHQDNDSDPVFTGIKNRMDARDIDAELEQHFGITRSELMAIRP